MKTIGWTTLDMGNVSTKFQHS